MALITGVVISLLLIIFSAWWYYLANKNKDFYKTIPGPPPLPIFGNSLDIKNTTNFVPQMVKYTKQYGGIVKVEFGPVHKVILVTDYKMTEGVLSSTKIIKKSREYGFLHQWLGDGLLVSDADKWRKHRRIITPTFHFQILEQFLHVFHSASSTLIEKLSKEVGKASVDIYPYVTLCALDVICETAMGVKINAQNESNSPYVRSIKTISKIIIERTFSVLQMFSVTYPLTSNYYTEKKCLKIIHENTNRVINERRKSSEINDKDSSKEDNFGGKQKLAFLDMLLQATKDGRPLTQEEIREEVDTFMFEGHDTTASAMSFALYSLAYNPEVQAKALEEQKAIFGDVKNPVPTYADLQSMTYLEKVIKETVRIYPTVPIYGRITTEPVEINGKKIPKDITFGIFSYGIHHNPDYFEDPEKFNPSRFENVDGKLPYAFIPFSAGPRNCIGQKLAMLEMKSTLSKVIRNFELQPSSPYHNLHLAFEMVLKSINGVKISLNLRS